MEYCKEERDELERFQQAYDRKKAELIEFDKKHGQVLYVQKEHSAKSVARAVAAGETPDVSTRTDTSLLDKRSELSTVVQLLHQAVGEQKRHVSERLKQEYWRAYPEHKKTVAAHKAFDEAIELIRKGLELDREANADLAKAGLPASVSWNECESNQLFNEKIRGLQLEHADALKQAMII